MTGNLMQSSAVSSGRMGREGKLTSCVGSGPRRLLSGGTIEQAFVRAEAGNVETMRSTTVYTEPIVLPCFQTHLSEGLEHVV